MEVLEVYVFYLTLLKQAVTEVNPSFPKEKPKPKTLVRPEVWELTCPASSLITMQRVHSLCSCTEAFCNLLCTRESNDTKCTAQENHAGLKHHLFIQVPLQKAGCICKSTDVSLYFSQVFSSPERHLLWDG